MGESMTQAFLDAVKAGDVAKVEALLAADRSLVNAKSDSGESAVLLATYHGHREVAQALLIYGPELNIHEASAVGDVERVRSCLEAAPGLINAYSHDGWTPLHLAAFFCHAETAGALVAGGADLHALARNGQANMPLHAAVAGRCKDVVALLLDEGADVRGRTGSGWTPLHLAAHGGLYEIADLLLDRGADVRAMNDGGDTPLAMAKEQGHQAVADALGQRGATE